MIDRIKNKFHSMDNKNIIIFLLIISIIIRILGFTIQSNDFTKYLNPWINYLKNNNGFGGLLTIYQKTNCNYYIPYLITLTIFSYFPISNLFIIKIISFISDFLCAIVIYKIVFHFSKDKSKSVIASFIYLLTPFVFINSSYWGQCDTIYTMFILFSLYFLICKNNTSFSLLFWFIGFTFKFQAIFFAPVLFILLINKRIKLNDFKYCCIYGILLIIISQILFGSIWNPIKYSYFAQTEATGGPILSSCLPNLYKIIDYFAIGTDIITEQNIGILVKYTTIIFAILTVFACIYFSKKYKSFEKRETSKYYLYLSTFFCLTTPYFLPLMHERYYYLACVMLLILILSDDNLLKLKLYFIAMSIVTYIHLAIYWLSSLSVKNCKYYCPWQMKTIYVHPYAEEVAVILSLIIGGYIYWFFVKIRRKMLEKIN